MNNEILPGFDDDVNEYLAIELLRMEGVDNGLAFRLRGQIDTYSSLSFQRRGQKAIDAGYARLSFHFDAVEYVSSMGIAALLQLQKAAREKGGDVVLVNLPPKISELFKLMCLEKYFTCADSQDEASALRTADAVDTVFPRTTGCPICQKRLRVLKSGRFRCPECRTILVVGRTGSLTAAE